MNHNRLLMLLILLGLIGFLPSTKASDEDDLENEFEVDDDEEEPVIELNPAYVEPAGLPTNSSDTEIEETEREGDVSAKTALGNALAKSRGTRRKALRILQKHHSKILVAMILVAFRREIAKFLFLVLATPQVDPKTGRITHRELRVHPMAVLKVILFVEIMRRIQQGSKPARAAAVLLAGNANPLFGTLMAKLLSPSNSAFIPPIEQHFTFERINERFVKDGMAFDKAMESSVTPHGRPFLLSTVVTSVSRKVTSPNNNNGTVIVMDLAGLDTRLSQLNTLQDEISFLLCQHRVQTNSTANTTNNDVVQDVTLEIVVLLESPGGSAQEYGLLAQQLLRLRNEPGIRVTICVDKVAASGGYMLACTASPGHLYVAPFAVVGSIGVIGQSINIHKVLEGWGVTPLVFRGGKDKAPLGLIGEVTDESIAKVQDMVDTIHTAFKQHVATSRPIVSDRIDELATGDVWLGSNAVEVGLADQVITSDEYIGERLRHGARVLKLIRNERPRFLFGPYSGSRGGLFSSTFPSTGALFVKFMVTLQNVLGLLSVSVQNFKNRIPDGNNI